MQNFSGFLQIMEDGLDFDFYFEGGYNWLKWRWGNDVINITFLLNFNLKFKSPLKFKNKIFTTVA